MTMPMSEYAVERSNKRSRRGNGNFYTILWRVWTMQFAHVQQLRLLFSCSRWTLLYCDASDWHRIAGQTPRPVEVRVWRFGRATCALRNPRFGSCWQRRRPMESCRASPAHPLAYIRSCIQGHLGSLCLVFSLGLFPALIHIVNLPCLSESIRLRQSSGLSRSQHLTSDPD